MKMNMIKTPHSKESYRQRAQLFKLLTHPARLAILDTLRSGEECVCHMEATLEYRQAYLSQQLAVLREAGIIQDRREGWNIFYHVVRPEVYAILDAAAGMSGSVAPPEPGRIVEEHCPCPKCTAQRGTPGGS